MAIIYPVLIIVVAILTGSDKSYFHEREVFWHEMPNLYRLGEDGYPVPLIQGDPSILDLAADVNIDRVFYSDWTNGEIRSISSNGLSPKSVVDSLVQPTTISIDAGRNRLYCVCKHPSGIGQTICYIDLDNSNVVQLNVHGNEIDQIEVDSTNNRLIVLADKRIGVLDLDTLARLPLTDFRWQCFALDRKEGAIYYWKLDLGELVVIDLQNRTNLRPIGIKLDSMPSQFAYMESVNTIVWAANKKIVQVSLDDPEQRIEFGAFNTRDIRAITAPVDSFEPVRFTEQVVWPYVLLLIFTSAILASLAARSFKQYYFVSPRKLIALLILSILISITLTLWAVSATPILGNRVDIFLATSKFNLEVSEGFLHYQRQSHPDFWSGCSRISEAIYGPIFFLPGLPHYQSITVTAVTSERLSVPLWMFAVTFAIYPVVFLWQFRRTKLRDKKGLCIKCGYDVASGNSSSCPECGLEVHIKAVIS